MPFFKHVLLNLGFVQLQVYEEPTDWGNYTYTRDVLRDARGEVLVVGLPHLSTFKIFSSAKCARATEELLERIAAHLQGKSFLPSGKIPESQSLSVFKPPARRSRPAATKRYLSLEDAEVIVGELVTLLQQKGHRASSRISKRVSIVVAGIPRQVIGIVPGKRARLSCPWFTGDMTPPGSVFKPWRGYNRIVLDAPSVEQVRDLCVKGLRRGGLL